MASDRHMLITAGPTREPVDPVRFLGNRSSGRMGVALAEAARRAGWQVTLLLGPCCAEPPEEVSVWRFETAAELGALLDEHWLGADALVMAAAVADFRPASASEAKLAREAPRQAIELAPTEDLVARCAQRRRPEQRIIGFALEEPARLDQRAAEKLARKGLDAIVANSLTTMDAETTEPLVLTAAGRRHQPGPMSKADFAEWLIGRIDDL